jgi:hypothetical protein
MVTASNMKNTIRYIRNENFVERKLGDETVLVPISQLGVDVQSIYTLNDTAAAVWKKLKTVHGEEDLIAAIEAEYYADSGVIRQDVQNLLEEFIEGAFINVVGE